jgi:putative lipoic acid-binding regulatory protein
MRKDEVRYRTVTTKNYTIQIPESWAMSEETPFGQREMSPKAGKGQLTSMTGPGLGKQSWEQLYQTSLYFILREQPAGSMTATPPVMGKTKQGFEAASWSMLDRKKTVVARYVVLKSKADNILALSVKIPAEADRTQLEAIFDRLVSTAIVK